MNKNLLIVFVKNPVLGKVKTRLANIIGHSEALFIYNALITVTEKESEKVSIERHIYFSDSIENELWKNDQKFIQIGKDLGERMQNAFQHEFNNGYENIVLIGSDLPDISKEIIENGFAALQENEIVFGPAEDGGYYLIGMSKMNADVFSNKPWSTPKLLEVTLQELTAKNKSAKLIQPLNDIDTFEDLIASDFYKENLKIQEIITL